VDSEFQKYIEIISKKERRLKDLEDGKYIIKTNKEYLEKLLEGKKLEEKISNKNDKEDKKFDGSISTQDSLGKLLNDLVITITGVESATIVSMEGAPIISVLPRHIDEKKITAVTATILILAERIIYEINTGDLEQLSFQGSNLNFLVIAAGENAVLTVSANKKVNLGMIFLECGRIGEKISKLI